jgi:PKD repeat protein
MREVFMPQGKTWNVVVVEFLTHGELAPDGRNLLVSSRTQQLAPSRVLQVGPGDFCRVAIQVIGGQREYEIFYGGEAVPEGVIPAWTNRDGLLMETHQYRESRANTLEALRSLFNSTKPIGSDYVEGVFHSFNPFTLAPGPFLTRYSGNMNISNTGKYGFFTGAVDYGYLFIDEKLVTSRRGTLHRAKPDARSDINLTAGTHKFEYFHGAAGHEAMIHAAWEVNPAASKPEAGKVVAIPADVWRSNAIGHVPCSPVTGRLAKIMPDFLVKIDGEVPLPDNDVPLVKVLFKDVTPRALTMKAKLLWDFGDGQTTDQDDPVHVYLRPGLYTVKLTVARQPKSEEIANRIYVDRPVETHRDKPQTLDEYLPLLAQFDPRTLDAASLRQLVLAYDAKAAAVDAEPDVSAKTDDSAPAPSKAALAAQRAEATKYIVHAVAEGKAAFVGESAATGDDNLIKLARLVGPMARDQAGNSELAYKIWRGAYQRIHNSEYQAECAAEAADVAVNDLLQPALAKPLIEEAAHTYDKNQTGTVAGNIRRVLGDYYAATGDGKAARKAYAEAEKVRNSNRNYIEQTALRGAHNRSTEEYIRSQQYPRAAAEVRDWQLDFPTEKIDGQLTVMYARYWAGRLMYDQVVALSDQLLTVNPDSPYADQLLLLAAACEAKHGNKDRAVALLHSLLKDYPGSPLVPIAKENMAKLQAAAVTPPPTVRKPRR